MGNWKKVAFVFGMILLIFGLLLFTRPGFTGSFVGIATTGISISTGLLLLFPLIFTLIAGESEVVEGKKEKKRISASVVADIIKYRCGMKGMGTVTVLKRVPKGCEDLEELYASYVVALPVKYKQKRTILDIIKRKPKEKSGYEDLAVVGHLGDEECIYILPLPGPGYDATLETYEELKSEGYNVKLAHEKLRKFRA